MKSLIQSTLLSLLLYTKTVLSDVVIVVDCSVTPNDSRCTNDNDSWTDGQIAAFVLFWVFMLGLIFVIVFMCCIPNHGSNHEIALMQQLKKNEALLKTYKKEEKSNKSRKYSKETDDDDDEV